VILVSCGRRSWYSSVCELTVNVSYRIYVNVSVRSKFLLIVSPDRILHELVQHQSCTSPRATICLSINYQKQTVIVFMYYFTCISFAIRPSGRKSAIKLIGLD